MLPSRDLLLGFALGSAVALLAVRQQGRRRRRSDGGPALAEDRVNVPDAQLDPTEFESSTDEDRLARRIETVLRRRTARVIVVLERLVDGHNFSAIFRTCEALGVQHVWLIAPPEEKFRSVQLQKRDFLDMQRDKFAAKDEKRKACEDAPDPTSRRGKRKERANTTWKVDSALDEEHAAFARGAARFLTIREFATAEACLTAVREVPGCEVWATDLGQGAQVLAPDAPWRRRAPLPERVALVLGTESLGVSDYVLQRADKRVYLPQNGFADSLNVSVAGALAIGQLLHFYGADACGDVYSGATAPWAGETPNELRASWARHIARDEAHHKRITDKLARFDDQADLLHDLRRAPTFRIHNGKAKKK